MQAQILECNTLIKANTYRQIIKVQMRKRVQQGTESDSVLLLSFQTILNKNIFEMTVSDSLLTVPPPMKSWLKTRNQRATSLSMRAES